MTDPTPSRALVVGLGSSGVAAASLLHRAGWRVSVNDRGEADALAARLGELPEGVDATLGGHPADLIDGVSLVVVSPGVPWDLPLLAAARERGTEVVAEVELAWRHIGDVPLVGVTGSNGKSTVTALIGSILRAAGFRTAVGANLGTPASQLVATGPWDAHVWELSSFQLEGCTTLRPTVGVLLNVSADHLDRHHDVGAYLRAKARLFAAQSPDDAAVLNGDDDLVRRLRTPARRFFFSLHAGRADGRLVDDTLVLDGTPLLHRDELPLLGDHNVANALAAALAALRLGVAAEAVARGLRSFEGLPHRHRLVAESRGVRFVDDSKGTNIGATAAGLAGYPAGTIHLILGGLGKGQDFHQLRDAVAGRVAHVYLIGESAPAIAAALADVVPVDDSGTLENAVARAAAAARPGDTVLLSPACASFDQFDDYGHRGDVFASLARAAAGGE